MPRTAALALKGIAVGAILVAAGWMVVAKERGGLAFLDAGEPRLAASPPPESPPGPPTGGVVMPVQGVAASALSDTFGNARAEGRRHDALDIMAPRGTLVLAAAAGRLEKLFVSKDGGNTAYVRSPDGTRLYYYAHLDRYAPALREGMALRRGQPIGTVGATGNADAQAPHLHFAILATSPDAKWWDASRPINPYPLLTPP